MTDVTIVRRRRTLSKLPRVGGGYETRPYLLDDVCVGNITFKDFVAYAVRSRGSHSGDEDGVLGSEFCIISRRSSTMRDSRIYLEPNSRVRQ